MNQPSGPLPLVLDALCQERGKILPFPRGRATESHWGCHRGVWGWGFRRLPNVASQSLPTLKPAIARGPIENWTTMLNKLTITGRAVALASSFRIQTPSPLPLREGQGEGELIPTIRNQTTTPQMKVLPSERFTIYRASERSRMSAGARYRDDLRFTGRGPC